MGLAGLLPACQAPQNFDDIPGAWVGPDPQRGHRVRASDTWPPPARQHRTGVLILGGGISALAAARALCQRGQDDFVLLEIDDQPGGNSRASELQGLACPLGAHYLPTPGDGAPEVQALLEELGLRRRVAGRWTYDERHLCHSPQERSYLDSGDGLRWHDGLLPLDSLSPSARAQTQRFARAVQDARRAASFPLPAFRAPWSAPLAAWDRLTLAAWLDQQGLDDPSLRTYLDYTCRDDYGAGLDTVSAWAGLHYFASRHGFQADPDDSSERDSVLTWPEGNGWLARALAQPLGERLRSGHTVLRVDEQRHQVVADVWVEARQQLERWTAPWAIVCLPVHVAQRVVLTPPERLTALTSRLQHAAWVVVNLHLRQAPLDRGGAAPAWDNVIWGSGSLGYVDASHQQLHPVPTGPKVLTWYRALGTAAPQRQALQHHDWRHWAQMAMRELASPHPDLPGLVSQVAVTRYGHAMAVPTPGLQTWLRRHQAPHTAVRQGHRLRFAHSDWSGYSVFEEAFTQGHLAGWVR